MGWFTVLSTFIVIGLAVYHYFRARNSLFIRLGLPGPKPKLLLGNLLDLWGQAIPLRLREWTKQYGTTYGYYDGGTPVMVTSNLDILQDVFVKKFSNFHGRKTFPLAGNPDKEKVTHVFAARGIRWKRLRTITNPTFSVVKLKELMPHFEESCKILVNRLNDQQATNQPLDIYPYFQEFTLDVIATIALGENDNLQGNPDNPYIETCRGISVHQRLLQTFSVVLPEMKDLWRFLAKLTASMRKIPFFILQEKLRNVIEKRRMEKDEQQHKTDFIQLFLNAEAEPGWEKQQNAMELQAVNDSQLQMNALKVQKKLSSEEIVAQCFVFLLAGYDTTSNTLAYASYLLACNPEIQEKLLEEIDQYCANEESITYETIQKMRYIDMVLKETLRLYPLASVVNSRQCMQACDVQGQFVPAGMFISADVWTIHYDKEIWGSDADQFRPERFEGRETRHPMAWMPFGAGPRICIGMRLGLLEAKVALCHVLRKFTLAKCDGTDVPLKLRGPATISPESVTLNLKARN